MKDQLQLCSLALNPVSPSPAASMVRIADGYMESFGGFFAIKVPFPAEVGCCFNPTAAMNFFRKPRKVVAYTVNKKKLVMAEGKEKLSIGCLPPEELETIDVIEKPSPAKLDMKMLKFAVEVSDPTNLQPFAQVVNFRDGLMNSTNNKVFFSGESGLPDDFTFALPKAACLALTKFKSPVVSVVANKFCVKFGFEDGSSLCSKQQVCDYPDIASLFEGKWTKFDLKEDLSKIDCDHFQFLNGSVYYHTNSSVGILEDVVNAEVSVSAFKRNLDYAIRLGNNLSLSENRLRIRSTGKNCIVICTVKKED